MINIKDIIKKTALLSIGLASIGKKKAEGLAKRLMKSKRLNAKDAGRIAKKMLRITLAEQRKIKVKLQKELKQSLNKIEKEGKKELARLAKTKNKVKKRKKRR